MDDSIKKETPKLNENDIKKLVEYVPSTHQNDRTLYEFFDTIFPGQVRRAEILLNTEHLRSLIGKRLNYIKSFEDYYAKKVHRWAQYLRDKDAVQKSGLIVKCCTGIKIAREPKEPKIVVISVVDREDMGNTFFAPQRKRVRDARTHEALPYNHEYVEKRRRNEAVALFGTSIRILIILFLTLPFPV